MASLDIGSLTPPSEQQLMAQCINGDMEAFGLLFERHQRAIYRYAYHMTGDLDAADDIKQDTFVKAHRALPNFRGGCTMLTWLLKIAGNLCLDRYKSHARHREVALSPEIEAAITGPTCFDLDPARLLERKETRVMVHLVLQGMPKQYREVIVLRDLEGLGYQQIGDVLGSSVCGIKLRLFRARRCFKERISAMQD